jgi:hypothetical protein
MPNGIAPIETVTVAALPTSRAGPEAALATSAREVRTTSVAATTGRGDAGLRYAAAA